MKSTSLILFLASLVLARSYAQDSVPAAAPEAQVANPPAATPVPTSTPNDAAAKTKKTAKSNIGDKSFMGDPDPLDVLEPKKQNNLNSEASEPVFEEITDILDEKPKKKKSDAKAEEAKLPNAKNQKEGAPASAESHESGSGSQAESVPQSPPNQDPPKPDILTEEFQTPAKETTSETTPVVVDVVKPVEVPPPEKKKKIMKPKKSDPLMADLISGDDPDFKREEKFNRLYKRYNINPTNEGEWGGASTGRQSMNYEIQRGDTLSDVSSTLFGDPKFWPKVWSLNSKAITNPHIVLPKQVLKFYPGTVDQPPSFNLTDTAISPNAPAIVQAPADVAAKTEDVASKDSEKESGMKSEPAAEALAVVNPPSAELNSKVTVQRSEKEIDVSPLPENESKSQVLKDLPQVFQREVLIKKPKQKIAVDFSDVFRSVSNELFFYIPYQISKKEGSSVGEIISASDGRTMIPDFTECTVQLSHSAEPNAVFYASTKRTDEGFGNETIVYENLGELEIIAAVNPSENLYRARMRKTIGMVQVGAKLFAGALPMFNIREKSAGSVVKAKILGAAHDDKSQIIGSNAFIVIEGGSNVGFVVGQEFAVLENQAVRSGDERIIQNERKIGKVHIVQVTEELSTAFVVTSDTEIKPGDFVGQLPDSAIIR